MNLSSDNNNIDNDNNGQGPAARPQQGWPAPARHWSSGDTGLIRLQMGPRDLLSVQCCQNLSLDSCGICRSSYDVDNHVILQ